MDEERIKKIIVEYESRPNKDLVDAMDFLQNDFEDTKKAIIRLTRHLDGTESVYNKLLKEYKKRNK
jgi:hypothetical protein